MSAWGENLKVDKVKLRFDAKVHKGFGTKVHKGFLQAYRPVKSLVRKDVKALGGVPLFITGHSLGGALATLATCDLAGLTAVRVKACYTFGGPRVGNTAFRRIMEQVPPVYRVVRQGDLVAEVPSMARFTHAGRLVYLDDKSRVRHKVRVTKRAWNLVKGIAKDIGKRGLALLKAHDHQRYADQLGEIALKRTGKT